MIDSNDLALKFRPKSWAEVVGQQAIVSILQRQVATKSWKNTYLFAGPYGCGKTTVARILANEINNGEGQPIEIDGAKNNGVDNIRNLIADAQQCPLDSNYKVYIIDEAHQITKAAWNAALKLIEEPPETSIFILCTTEFNKIPETILSRVQTFLFRKVDKSVIADRLEFILNEETDVKYERSALERIASLSGGHVRDAVKILDKCLGCMDSITVKNVEATLGVVKTESFLTIIDSILKKDIKSCMKEFNNISSYSSDMLNVMDELISISLDCALYVLTGNSNSVSIPSDVCTSLKKSDLYKTLVNRLLTFRKFADRSNAEVLMKTVFMEMCQ